ncbi:hypothetical protein NLU13_8612 [Sarocladium strictum]|uniref:Uncharacterized protein n=1 Tax=Sarocladium strictum TaxID=5046 RepID=A0AA39L4T7_SARSR|nr:hypothetical protein NLU13_8612 [Sarocladium strictum]
MEHGTAAAVAVTLLLVVATTHFLTGRTRSNDEADDVPSMPPFWFPVLGHWPEMKWSPDSFLARLNKRYPEGIFSLNLVGSIHTFVARPSLITQLVDLPEAVATSDMIRMRLMYSNFGLRKGDSEELVRKVDELDAILCAPGELDRMMDTTVRTLNRNIADWVTFNSQPADQMEWEEVAGADVVEDGLGENVVEVDLKELTMAFVARVTTPSIFGTDFCDNFPDFTQHLWRLEQHFALLASNLSAGVPYRGLQLARGARRKLLAYLEEYHTELEKAASGEDNDPKWDNLDNVSSYMKARQALFRKEGASIRVRAALDLRVLWAVNANSAPLIFWMLYEINRDPVLVEQIRDEIAPYMDVVQPKNDFGLAVWMAPEMRNVDMDGLMEKCPLLKGSCLETLRLYTAFDTIKCLKEDAVLGKPFDARGRGGYLLRKGTFAHATYELHQLDPVAYPEPHEWQPSRHFKYNADGGGDRRRLAPMPHPLVDKSNTSTGHNLTEREVMLFTAAILSMYDIQPAAGLRWESQKLFKTTSTKHPSRSVKAWIRRREVRQETAGA